MLKNFVQNCLFEFSALYRQRVSYYSYFLSINRNENRENSSHPHAALDRDLPPITLKNTVDYREPQARASFLCSKERVENLADYFLPDPHSRVSHPDFSPGLRWEKRSSGIALRQLNPEFTALGHGLGSVDEKVPEDLPDLMGIALYMKFILKPGLQADFRVEVGAAGKHLEDFFNQPI